MFTHVDDYIQCLNIVHDITDDADTQNDITPNFVQMISHWRFAKLLSFTTDQKMDLE